MCISFSLASHFCEASVLKPFLLTILQFHKPYNLMNLWSAVPLAHLEAMDLSNFCLMGWNPSSRPLQVNASARFQVNSFLCQNIVWGAHPSILAQNMETMEQIAARKSGTVQDTNNFFKDQLLCSINGLWLIFLLRLPVCQSLQVHLQNDPLDWRCDFSR